MSAQTSAKPTIGFDTKKQAIVHLHGLGLSRSTIAHEVGCTPNGVSTILSRAGIKAHPAPVWRPTSQASFIGLSSDVVRLLRPHAARRGLTCAALAAQIVDTVVTGGLIDATLDDREG